MLSSNYLRVRQSISELQAKYDGGDKKPLEDLVRAWIGIQALPYSDPHSLFVLSGYHGEPFDYRKDVDRLPETDSYAYWGGYCNHGNVLFPTWHRVYVLKVEEALQSIIPGVSMPYWDETSALTRVEGIPRILTQETFMLDGEPIKNPFRSYVLPHGLSDDIGSDYGSYAKPKGYETVRYPLSGLVGTEQDRIETEQHNAKYRDPVENVRLLNNNVRAWLLGGEPSHPMPSRDGVYAQFQDCLEAPNYTVFSNQTSAAAWNNSNPGQPNVVPLESPHNDIHLAVGGFDHAILGHPSGQLAGANGDMGENNTASMDPIFFFHHCNVDRMFWLWQKRNGHTKHIDIIPGFPGTNSNDSQGPVTGFAPGTKLDMQTPLAPFLKANGTPYMSEDCVDIQRLGFTYSPGSFDDEADSSAAPSTSLMKSMGSSEGTRKLCASGINRALFQGSFVLRAYATVKDANGDTVDHYLGHHSVLSRYNVVKCANCLTHLEVVAHFPLTTALTSRAADDSSTTTYRIEVQHHGHSLPTRAAKRSTSAALPAGLKINLAVIE